LESLKKQDYFGDLSIEIKVKLSLFLTKPHAMKMYGEVTLALNRTE
jgi:hypothetical protein